MRLTSLPTYMITESTTTAATPSAKRDPNWDAQPAVGDTR